MQAAYPLTYNPAKARSNRVINLQRKFIGRLLAFSGALVLLHSTPCRAQEDDDYRPGMPGVVTSMDAFNTGTLHSPAAAMLQADYYQRTGNYEKCIQLCRTAFRQVDDDLDYHVIYATALEEKLRHQKPKDPRLFNEVVKEWLTIYRSEKGDDKGLSWKGLMLPGSHKYDDEERQIPAKQHLVALTGRAPRQKETDSKYLQNVQIDTTTDVNGKIVDQGKNSGKNSKDSRRDQIATPHRSALNDY